MAAASAAPSMLATRMRGRDVVEARERGPWDMPRSFPPSRAPLQGPLDAQRLPARGFGPNAASRALSLRLHEPPGGRQPEGLVRPEGERGDHQGAEGRPARAGAREDHARLHVELPRSVR